MTKEEVLESGLLSLQKQTNKKCETCREGILEKQAYYANREVLIRYLEIGCVTEWEQN
jgi:hypothetical protein